MGGGVSGISLPGCTGMQYMWVQNRPDNKIQVGKRSIFMDGLKEDNLNPYTDQRIILTKKKCSNAWPANASTPDDAQHISKSGIIFLCISCDLFVTLLQRSLLSKLCNPALRINGNIYLSLFGWDDDFILKEEYNGVNAHSCMDLMDARIVDFNTILVMILMKLNRYLIFFHAKS